MESSEDKILGLSPPELLKSLILISSDEVQSLGSSPRLNQLSPAALAYVGDAIYELYIRTHYLLPPKRLQVYHEQVVAQVRAESQAQHLQSLQPHLTNTELEILKRGRNAASKGPKRQGNCKARAQKPEEMIEFNKNKRETSKELQK